MNKYKKWILWGIGELFVLGVCVLALSNWYIFSFDGDILDSVEAVSPQEMALIFGGGMKDDGVTMSEMQEDRVKRGIELFQAGKVQRLVMTGDNGDNNSNEVGAMQAYAVNAGVPEAAVSVDPHGYNTYKSCERASEVYGVTSTIVVSQGFHLPRIVYFCSRQGISVTPVASDLRNYGWWAAVWPQGGREWLARFKAVMSGQSSVIGNVVVY